MFVTKRRNLVRWFADFRALDGVASALLRALLALRDDPAHCAVQDYGFATLVALVATPADIRRQMARLGFIASDDQLGITPAQLAGGAPGGALQVLMATDIVGTRRYRAPDGQTIKAADHAALIAEVGWNSHTHQLTLALSSDLPVLFGPAFIEAVD